MCSKICPVSGRRPFSKLSKIDRSYGLPAPTSRGPSKARFRVPCGWGGGQRLIACPLLDAALELLKRHRRCSSRVPNDPDDLTNATAPTATCKGPSSEGRALAVSAAALADNVCDSWHRRPLQAADFRGAGATLRRRQGIRAICALTGRRKAGRWLSVESHGKRNRRGARVTTRIAGPSSAAQAASRAVGTPLACSVPPRGS
jgi:hypothetical protein